VSKVNHIIVHVKINKQMWLPRGCRSQINKDCITLLNCNMAYIGATKLGGPGQ